MDKSGHAPNWIVVVNDSFKKWKPGTCKNFMCHCG